MTKRQPAEVRRSKILDGATSLFVRDGLDATSMEAVAASADIAKGTVYLYFPSRSELGGCSTSSPTSRCESWLWLVQSRPMPRRGPRMQRSTHSCPTRRFFRMRLCVVSHAGHASVAAALAYRVPLVYMPSVGADQPIIAE